jgi:hypothetical protein
MSSRNWEGGKMAEQSQNLIPPLLFWGEFAQTKGSELGIVV